MFSTIKDMPGIGFGLWKIPQAGCAEVVFEAVKAGYRHFDSAADYGNEAQVGEGLARALAAGLCARSDLWTQTASWGYVSILKFSGLVSIPRPRARPL